jgi:hypothetical protein
MGKPLSAWEFNLFGNYLAARLGEARGSVLQTRMAHIGQ